MLIQTKQHLAGTEEIIPHKPPPELGTAWGWHRALQAAAQLILTMDIVTLMIPLGRSSDEA